MAGDDPVLAFTTRDDFEAWLAGQPRDASGLWMRIAKKGSGVETVDHPEALEIALCHGWIDGQRKALDETYFLQRFTPRRPRSRWSRINRDKAERLIAEGRMRPAGLAEVQRAKDDGRWEAAYAGQRAIEMPDDLRAALDAEPGAAAFFAALSSQNRYAILYRVQDAKRPETRARRIATFVAMCAAGETVHPQRAGGVTPGG